MGVYSGYPAFLNAGADSLISCNYDNYPNLDHNVLLVGYTTTHWIIKNSWGTGWADQGYGYITKDPDHDCYIRQYVSMMAVNFGYTPSTMKKRIIFMTLTDSGGDGWNGNLLGIKQNNAVRWSIGGAFTSGS